MGSINFGNQTLSLGFDAPGTSFDINQMFYGIIPTGILSGGALTKTGANSITVDPLVCWISDTINKVALKVATTTQVALAVSSTNIYIILRFSWVNSATNYMDVLAVPFNSVNASDLIIGKCIYIGGVLQATFDYTEATNFDYTALQIKSKDFLVQATEPYSSTVNVLSGKFVTGNQYVAFTGPSASPALNNTILGRIDLIYIDEAGAVQKVEGVDSATPVAPLYFGKNVVAEIHRGALASYISGDQIVSTSTQYKAIGLGNSIVVSNLNLGTGAGQINASSIPIIDSAGIITGTNIDTALTELAFGQAMVIQAGSAAISVGDFVIFSLTGAIRFLPTSTALQTMGIALTAGSVGDTIGVSFRKYVPGLSGLIPGEIYWIGQNGTLSLTDKSIAPYAKALSATELLLL